MPAMSKPLPRLAASIALGAILTAIFVALPILRVDRGSGGTIRRIYRGEHEWIHARDAAFGLDWPNLELAPTRMITPLVEGTLPAWAEPPSPPYPQVAFLRIGTLASGWPFRAVVFRWTVTTTTRSFPVNAELDDGDTSISSAAESVRTGGRGGPPDERRLLWPGLLANFGIFTVSALAILSTAVRVQSPRGASTR
jgi:hypothetical protein